MEKSPKSYLKLTFSKALIQKDIRFETLKPKSPNLNFIINAQILDPSLTRVGKISSVKLKEKYTDEGSIFSDYRTRWDCFKLNPQQINSKLQLKLQIQIQKNNNSGCLGGNSVEKSIQKSPSESKLQTMANFFISKTMQGNIKFPVKLNSMKISLQQFIKQPYKTHSISLDFRIPNEQKISESKRSAGERDGMVNFQLCLLPQIAPQLAIRNLCLKTKEFYKSYKVGIFEAVTERENKKRDKIEQMERQLCKSAYLQRDHAEKRIKKVHEISACKSNLVELPLQVHEWEEFRNFSSFKEPVVYPLELLNEHDQIAILFQYEVVPLQNALVNILTFELMGLNNTNQAKSGMKVVNTFQNIIKLEDLVMKQQKSKSQWQHQTISCTNRSQGLEFQLHFQYNIKLHKHNLQQEDSVVSNSSHNFDIVNDEQTQQAKQDQKEPENQESVTSIPAATQPNPLLNFLGFL